MVIAAAGGFPVPVAGGSTDVERVADALRSVAPRNGEVVDVADAGAAMRFLAAYYASLPGADLVLTGTERMKQRPIGPLVDALRTLGAEIEYAGTEGFPPLHICGRELQGGDASIDASLSSQFVSALMMIAPRCKNPVSIRLEGESVASVPYILLTHGEMRRCGAEVHLDSRFVSIAPQGYSIAPQPEDCEGDWSAAAFILEALLLLPPGSRALIFPLSPPESSTQGDAAAASYFRALGVEMRLSENGMEARAVKTPSCPRLDADMRRTPDLVPALAVAAAAAGVPFRFTGVSALRLKESDRLAALASEAAKFGFSFKVYDNVLESDSMRRPAQPLPAVDTYRDHRIAMAFAAAAPALGPMVVRDFEVVGKSFPDVAAQLAKLGIASEKL